MVRLPGRFKSEAGGMFSVYSAFFLLFLVKITRKVTEEYLQHYNLPKKVAFPSTSHYICIYFPSNVEKFRCIDGFKLLVASWVIRARL